MAKHIPPGRSLLILALVLCAGLFVFGGVDSDGYGIPDTEDNCPAVANADQANGDVTAFGPQKIIGAAGPITTLGTSTAAILPICWREGCTPSPPT